MAQVAQCFLLEATLEHLGKWGLDASDVAKGGYYTVHLQVNTGLLPCSLTKGSNYTIC